MLKNLGNYRSALYLTSAVALIELAAFLYLVSFGIEAAMSFSMRSVIALIIVFGIWVQSNVARYLGAAWLVLLAASGVWRLFTGDPGGVSVALVLYQIVGVPSFMASYILVFSKTFSDEFIHERQTQPKYKRLVKRIAFVALIVVIVIAVINDIYRIALRFSSY